MPKINREEYEVLKGLDEKWKWIARNYNGALITFTSKPTKNPNLYWDSFGERMDDRLFQFIQWEDEEPYSIAELIEEYEYSTEHVSHVVNERVKALGKVWSESEEKEVKDLGWLKRSIDKRIKTIESDDITFVGSEYYDEGYIDGMRDVLYRIDQLDEPEVLPQELPVIPKFVAEWYESEGKRSSWWNWFYKWGRDEGRTELEAKTIRWMQDFNEELFVDTFRRGYEVEEEPQYRLKAGENYLYFNLDGTVRGATKDNATITNERLEQLPFDVEKAVESGIIEIEEVKEC